MRSYPSSAKSFANSKPMPKEASVTTARRRTVSTARTPWIVGRKVTGSMPWRIAHSLHTRSVASMELNIVPSMSKRNASNDLPKGEKEVTLNVL